ncbi:methyltransferase [Catalinimonas sp. 4WD22]|uniref:methyltransferase n=1 Tax=Catalinimonas locisalis TaxID=3133978 RepID=UPI003101341B
MKKITVSDQLNTTPERIMQIATGFCSSKILMSAVNFGLFTLLTEKKSMSARQIKLQLNFKCTDRQLYDYLDALLGMGFLQREGVLSSAIYYNSTETDRFLDKNKPLYMGTYIELLNDRLNGFWDHFEEGLLTGQSPVNFQNEHYFFEEIQQDPVRLKGFVNAMNGMQMGNFEAFASKFDFSGYTTLTDAGGCGGLLCLTVARQHPHMHCISFDLPALQPIARFSIQEAGLEERVNAVSGDFFVDPLPEAEVVVMCNILHKWDEKKKLELMKAAYEALPPGGALVAIENIIDSERKNNVFGLMVSLNILFEAESGFDYTFWDFQQWANHTGFSSAEIIPLAGADSAVIAYK